MKLPLSTPKFKPRRLVTLFIGLVYTIICAFILIPQIDYQPWYPEQLNTLNIPLGIDFSQHIRSTSNIGGWDIPEWKRAKVYQLISMRLSRAGVPDVRMQETDEGLVIDISEEYGVGIFPSLLAKGEMEFKKPKADVNFEENPLAFFDTDNFEDTDLKPSDIQSSKINTTTDQFTYIELRIRSDKLKAWETYSENNPDGTFGLFIDKTPYQAWLLPADGTQVKYPNLVITEQSPQSSFIYSYIQDGTLPTSTLPYETETVDAQYGQAALRSILITLAVLPVLGLIIRYFLYREDIVQIIALGLMLVGTATLLKTTGILFSVPVFLGLVLIVGSIVLVPSSAHLPMMVLLMLLSIPAQLSNSPELAPLSSMMMIFGAFGLISIFFFKFVQLYEE